MHDIPYKKVEHIINTAISNVVGLQNKEDTFSRSWQQYAVALAMLDTLKKELLQ